LVDTFDVAGAFFAGFSCALVSLVAENKIKMRALDFSNQLSGDLMNASFSIGNNGMNPHTADFGRAFSSVSGKRLPFNAYGERGVFNAPVSVPEPGHN
jgi:hypothetical protein